MSDKLREALERLRQEAKWIERDQNKYAECAYSPTADTLECIADDIEAALAEKPAKGEAGSRPTFNKWWMSLPEGRRKALTNDKWALASAAYDAAPPAPSVPPEVRDALIEARDIAMRFALEARIPECGHFGAIAQNLDYVCATMLAAAPEAKS